jgi:hypothetical protein
VRSLSTAARSPYARLALTFVLGAMMAGSHGAAQTGSNITPASWTSIGPGNIGGRVRSIAFHPTSASTFFVGAAGGGLWKTTSSGVSWTAVSAFLPSFVVTSVVFRPGDPSTMYAGTGEGFQAVDSIRGAGVHQYE